MGRGDQAAGTGQVDAADVVIVRGRPDVDEVEALRLALEQLEVRRSRTRQDDVPAGRGRRLDRATWPARLVPFRPGGAWSPPPPARR